MKVSHGRELEKVNAAMHESCKYILECYKDLVGFLQNCPAILEQLVGMLLTQEQRVKNGERWREAQSDKSDRLEIHLNKRHF